MLWIGFTFSVWKHVIFATGHVLFMIGTTPVIRCPRGNAAEMVAEVTESALAYSVVYVLFVV